MIIKPDLGQQDIISPNRYKIWIRSYIARLSLRIFSNYNEFYCGTPTRPMKKAIRDTRSQVDVMLRSLLPGRRSQT